MKNLSSCLTNKERNESNGSQEPLCDTLCYFLKCTSKVVIPVISATISLLSKFSYNKDRGCLSKMCKMTYAAIKLRQIQLFLLKSQFLLLVN